ncbi:MAG: hypothetical protein IKR91_07310 [Alloprevotella sp.]|nr:hypothetical protein [Alloprevotella sp.]
MTRDFLQNRTQIWGISAKILTLRKSDKEIFGLLKVIPESNKEILKFLKEIFTFLGRKITEKWLGFSKIKRKSEPEFCIYLKLKCFRKMQKTGIFRTKIFGDDFYARFSSSKTGGLG